MDTVFLAEHHVAGAFGDAPLRQPILAPDTPKKSLARPLQ